MYFARYTKRRFLFANVVRVVPACMPARACSCLQPHGRVVSYSIEYIRACGLWKATLTLPRGNMEGCVPSQEAR